MPRTNIMKPKVAPVRKKKVKYKKIVFKITVGQKEALDLMCKKQRTTPVKFLKSQISKQVTKYRTNPEPPNYVTENQLQLFDMNNPPL